MENSIIHPKSFYKKLKQNIHLILLLLILTGCPADQQKKLAKEIYENKMDFNFKDSWKINYHGLSFRLPKKFSGSSFSSYNTTCVDGSDCKTYSIEELQLYFGISEITQRELSNIRFLANEENALEAILEDATRKRKKSINDKGRISEAVSFKKNVNCLIKTVMEPFVKTYNWETDNSSLYYVAAIQKKNRYYIVQFCGRADKMRYFLDDLKKVLNF